MLAQGRDWVPGQRCVVAVEGMAVEEGDSSGFAPVIRRRAIVRCLRSAQVVLREPMRSRALHMQVVLAGQHTGPVEEVVAAQISSKSTIAQDNSMRLHLIRGTVSSIVSARS